MSEPHTPTALLSVESLSRLHVRASFELNSGECIALQGASGSGKTVLMRAIADLDPNEGTVKLDGVLRESVPGPMWRRQVTYVAAEPGWWADTVQEHFTNWANAQPRSKNCACRQIAAVGKSGDSQPVRSELGNA